MGSGVWTLKPFSNVSARCPAISHRGSLSATATARCRERLVPGFGHLARRNSDAGSLMLKTLPPSQWTSTNRLGTSVCGAKRFFEGFTLFNGEEILQRCLTNLLSFVLSSGASSQIQPLGYHAAEPKDLSENRQRPVGSACANFKMATKSLGDIFPENRGLDHVRTYETYRKL